MRGNDAPKAPPSSDPETPDQGFHPEQRKQVDRSYRGDVFNKITTRKTPPSPAMTRVIAWFSPAAPSPHCTPRLDARIHNHLADHLRRRRWPPPPRPGLEPPTSSCRVPSPEAACRAETKDAHDGSRNHHPDPNGIQIGHPSCLCFCCCSKLLTL